MPSAQMIKERKPGGIHENVQYGPISKTIYLGNRLYTWWRKSLHPLLHSIFITAFPSLLPLPSLLASGSSYAAIFSRAFYQAKTFFLISSFPLVLFRLSRLLSQYSIYQALQKAGTRTLDWYTQRYLSRKDLKCWISQGQSLQNQTARGHPTLKGWGMLRAARPVFRNSEIIQS